MPNADARNCISWLSRALRIFARTLIIDSHGGLELAPSRENSLRLLDAGDLTARQRLAIRAYVLFDVLMTGIELPPQPLSRFLSRLAQREGIMLYVPKTYFTDSERVELQYDARGGIYSQPQSRQHHQLVAGFLIPRERSWEVYSPAGCGHWRAMPVLEQNAARGIFSHWVR
ncbi:unnamed protein product [Effrenium voratum]|uniref:Uncharacterized protein n=1 Tax=Effrenium voratum TaxID=2562239 RepID=A0AA36JF79_9DINO|nr:unnamed protein product [Effrenium voratum]